MADSVRRLHLEATGYLVSVIGAASAPDAKWKKVGLGWVDFKVMRRSNATLGHGEVDPKVAADQRGHDVDVSLNVYTKTDMKQRAAVARKLENVVLGPKVVRMPGSKAS